VPGEQVTWDLVTRTAPPALADYAFDYIGYHDETGAFRQITTPSGGVVFILNLGDPYRIQNGAGAAPENFDSFIAGLSDVPGYVDATGLSAGVQVNLTPVGARLLTGLPMHLLTNAVLNAEEAFGPASSELIERLRAATNWGARFQIIDRFIQARLLASKERPDAMLWAYATLRRTSGAASIASLAAALGYSQKQLIAQFREHLGLPPKTLARVMRFEVALRMIRDGGRPDWAQIVLDCGYYDQAHLIREFREFAGMTPGEYAGRLSPGNVNIIERYERAAER
jgi:AraC-like DNA-binding protein